MTTVICPVCEKPRMIKSTIASKVRRSQQSPCRSCSVSGRTDTPPGRTLNIPCVECGADRIVSTRNRIRTEGRPCMKCYGKARRKGTPEEVAEARRLRKNELAKARRAAAPKVRREPTTRAPKSQPAPTLKVSAYKHTTPPKTYEPRSVDECGHERADGSVCARVWPCKFHGGGE